MRRPFHRPRTAALLLAALLLSVPADSAGIPGGQDGGEEVMRRVFPGARSIERETAYLTEEQLGRMAEMAGEDAVSGSALAPYLVARGEEGVLGYGYLDTREVRTLPATLLVLVDPEGRIAHVEILVFREPPDYLPPEAWLAQLLGQDLGPDLSLKGEIRGITGATLTARAFTRAARRALALHQVLHGDGTGRGDGGT